VAEFGVVPEELRATAGQVEPLSEATEACGGRLEPPAQAAVAAHPEFITSEALEPFGARMVEVLQGLGRSYAQHASLLQQQATSYEQSDGGNSRLFQV
jgi:hypothetical protein